MTVQLFYGSNTITANFPAFQLHAATLFNAQAATADSIGINFVGAATAVASGDYAGVLYRKNWNNAATASGTLASGVLTDNIGAVIPGASITWASNATGALLTLSDTAGNARMSNTC